MHDVNPLGPMMHLKELDHQAIPRLRPLRTGRQNGFSLIGIKSSMIGFLRHPHAFRLFGARRGMPQVRPGPS